MHAALQRALRRHRAMDRSRGRLLPLGHAGERRRHDANCSRSRWPRASRSSPARPSPPPAGSPTRSGCASPRRRRTGSTKASPGCAGPSTCSRRADRRHVRRRAVRRWTGSTMTGWPELTTVAGAGGRAESARRGGRDGGSTQRGRSRTGTRRRGDLRLSPAATTCGSRWRAAPDPACCCWAIAMSFRLARAGPGTRSAATSSMVASMAVARPT